MGSCAAPSAKGDDKFITTDYLQQCHDAQHSLAFLAAMATTARQYPLRSTSEQTQRLNKSVLFSAPISTERAPCTRSVRRYESPAFVILPNFDFPPLLYCDGVNPSQAASCRPFLKSCALPIQATRAQAVVGPTPFSFISR